MQTCEIYLMIDENGGYTVATDVDDLDPGNLEGRITRVIRLLVTTERPTDTTVKVTLPSTPDGVPVVTMG